MSTIATLQRRLDRLADSLPSNNCRCPGPVALIQAGEQAPDRCPRCGGVNPPTLEITEEIVVATPATEVDQ